MTATAHTRRYGIKTMLPQRWSVRGDQPDGVHDTEAFCMKIVEQACHRQAMPRLEPCDLETAVAFLLGQIVAVEPDFDDEKARKPYLRFDLWLRTALYCDLLDFWRSPAGFGRHGQHRVPHAASGEQELNDQADTHGDGDADLDGGCARDDRLDPASLDDPADSLEARRWLDPEADRDRAGQVGGLRRTAGQIAAGCDHRAGARARRPARPAASGPAGVAAAWVDCGGCGHRHYACPPNGVAAWHYPDWCVRCGVALFDLKVAQVRVGVEESELAA